MKVNYQKKYAEICLMYEELEHAVSSPVIGMPDFFEVLKKVDLFVLRLHFQPEAQMRLPPLRDKQPANQPREFIFDVRNQLLEELLDFNYEVLHCISLYQANGTNFRLSAYTQIFFEALFELIIYVSIRFDNDSLPMQIMKHLNADIKKRRFTAYHEAVFNLLIREIHQRCSPNSVLRRREIVALGQANKKYRGLKLYLEDLLKQHGQLVAMSFKLELDTPQDNLLRFIEPQSFNYSPCRVSTKLRWEISTKRAKPIHGSEQVPAIKLKPSTVVPLNLSSINMFIHKKGFPVSPSTDYFRKEESYLRIVFNQQVDFYANDKVRLAQTEALIDKFEKLKNNGRNHQLLSICKGYMAFLLPNFVEADQIRVVFFFAAKDVPDVEMHGHLLKQYWFENITEQKGQMTEVRMGKPEPLGQWYFSVSKKSKKNKVLLLDHLARFYTHVDVYFGIYSLHTGNYFFRGEMKVSSTMRSKQDKLTEPKKVPGIHPFYTSSSTQGLKKTKKATRDYKDQSTPTNPITDRYMPEEDPYEEEDDKLPPKKVPSSTAPSQKQRKIYAAAEKNFPETLQEVKIYQEGRRRLGKT